jgi:type IV pilus assembly protein PilA
MENKLPRMAWTSMQQSGFTLMELMITVAIIGIIAAIAIPSYLDYTRKAHFSELVQATGPYIVGVADCFHALGTLDGCDSGSGGIPPAISSSIGRVASLSVNKGQIIVTPVPAHGLVASDTYILTPTINNGAITWTSSGGGVIKGYAK